MVDRKREEGRMPGVETVTEGKGGEYRMTARPQLPRRPLWRLLVAGIYAAVGAVSAYFGLIAVAVILASSMIDGRPDWFGGAVYATGTAVVVGMLLSTAWALAWAPADEPLSTRRRVIFALGTIKFAVGLAFSYWFLLY
jgi:hypothetical protein